MGQILGRERPLHDDLKSEGRRHATRVRWGSAQPQVSLEVVLEQGPTLCASRCMVFPQEATPGCDGLGQAWLGHHLVRAPAPRGQHCEPENEAWPRNVPVHRVPEHVEGIRPGEMAGGIGDCGIRDGLSVPLLQAGVPAYFLKACGERPQYVTQP